MPSIPINFGREKLYIAPKYQKHFSKLMEIAFNEYPYLQLKIKNGPGGALDSVKNTHWVYICLQPKIDTNTNLFIMAHEVGHIMAGLIDDYHAGKLPTIEEEIKADEWALKKFREWNINISYHIDQLIGMNRILFSTGRANNGKRMDDC